MKPHVADRLRSEYLTIDPAVSTLCLTLHQITGPYEVGHSAQILHWANYHAWL